MIDYLNFINGTNKKSLCTNLPKKGILSDNNNISSTPSSTTVGSQRRGLNFISDTDSSDNENEVPVWLKRLEEELSMKKQNSNDTDKPEKSEINNKKESSCDESNKQMCGKDLISCADSNFTTRTEKQEPNKLNKKLPFQGKTKIAASTHSDSSDMHLALQIEEDFEKVKKKKKKPAPVDDSDDSASDDDIRKTKRSPKKIRPAKSKIASEASEDEEKITKNKFALIEKSDDSASSVGSNINTPKKKKYVAKLKKNSVMLDKEVLSDRDNDGSSSDEELKIKDKQTSKKKKFNFVYLKKNSLIKIKKCSSVTESEKNENSDNVTSSKALQTPKKKPGKSKKASDDIDKIEISKSAKKAFHKEKLEEKNGSEAGQSNTEDNADYEKLTKSTKSKKRKHSEEVEGMNEKKRPILEAEEDETNEKSTKRRRVSTKTNEDPHEFRLKKLRKCAYHASIIPPYKKLFQDVDKITKQIKILEDYLIEKMRIEKPITIEKCQKYKLQREIDNERDSLANNIIFEAESGKRVTRSTRCNAVPKRSGAAVIDEYDDDEEDDNENKDEEPNLFAGLAGIVSSDDDD